MTTKPAASTSPSAPAQATAEAEAAELPILEVDKLWKRVDNDAAFLAETCEMFAEDYPALFAAVEAALAKADAPAAAVAAHTLKGMIGNFCAPRAQAAAARLESAARTGNASDAAGMVDELRQELAALDAALKTLPRSP